LVQTLVALQFLHVNLDMFLSVTFVLNVPQLPLHVLLDVLQLDSLAQLALVLNVIKMLYLAQVLQLLPLVYLDTSFLQVIFVLLVQLELNHVHLLLL